MRRTRALFPSAVPAKVSRPFINPSSTTMGPLFTRPSRGALMFWAVLAMLNLAAGIVISTEPNRLSDFETVTGWGRDWLLFGNSLYDSPDHVVHYPPNAVVLLSPLAALPIALAVPLWVMLNICFACLAPYLAARFFRPHDSFKGVVLPILMFLTWGGVRTLTQFTLLALVFSMGALYLGSRRRLAAGMWLGLAMIKPQVAVPVFLWTVFTRRWRLVAISLMTTVVLCAIFWVRAQVSPLLIASRYTALLVDYQVGDTILAGLSELRPLIQRFVIDPNQLDTITGSVALALLAAICVAGFQEGAFRTRVLYAAPPLIACWSLLTFYHLTYGFIVLLPVMMLLALNDAESSLLRKALFWVLQMGMMFDVPGISRRLGLAGTPVYDAVLIHVDRVLILTIFVGLVALAWREAPEDRAPAHGL